eukprot:1575898-Pyramimonas_sp.AAC.1
MSTISATRLFPPRWRLPASTPRHCAQRGVRSVAALKRSSYQSTRATTTFQRRHDNRRDRLHDAICCRTARAAQLALGRVARRPARGGSARRAAQVHDA